jgi:ABC-type dipeptide/oligopeptide/nickel transport system permease component
VLLSLLMRRILWVPPTLFIVSVATFLLLSFVPPAISPGSSAVDAERERAELEALPRFFNVAPRDVRVRSTQAAEHVAGGGPEAHAAEAELARLGGAALPYVIPKLDGFAPEPRARVALALAPVAERMGLDDLDQARDPRTAANFWLRLWETRSVEFRPATARTTVSRLARRPTAARARELAKLDTYALPALFERLEAPESEAELATTRALVDAIARVVGVDDRLAPHDGLEEARASVARWSVYWVSHASSFRSYEGAARAAAMIQETRYARWASTAVLNLLGNSAETRATMRRARAALPITLGLLLGGIALAHLAGIALGTMSAVARGKSLDYVVAALVLGLYALPTAALAAWLHRLELGTGLWLPTCVVAAGLVAAPMRHQRAALVSVLSGEAVRAARARGSSRLRATTLHGVRRAIASVLSLLAVEPPMALSAVFVVEHVFSLDGLGAMTLEAVARRDVSYLMALSMAAATLAVAVVLVLDLSQSVLDPRQRSKILRGV